MMVQTIMDKPAVLVVCGPTGSGKTSLTFTLAEKIPLEIISADSRQVYRRMDIGTAKATAEERKTVPHHLIDVIDPDQDFSVAEFVDQARPLIEEICARGNVPCIAGGTGLYIRALLGGLAQLPTGDPDLRKQLQQRENEVPGALYNDLQKVDPEAAVDIHANNIVRIVRALEVNALTGRKMSELKAEHQFAEQPYRVLKLAPSFSRVELYKRINKRSEEMIAAGLVAEVKELVASYSLDLKALQTLGYREVVSHLKGEITAAQMVSDIQKYTRQYAKRQLTWFRKESDVIWVDSTIESVKLVASIEHFLHL